MPGHEVLTPPLSRVRLTPLTGACGASFREETMTANEWHTANRSKFVHHLPLITITMRLITANSCQNSIQNSELTQADGLLLRQPSGQTP